MPLTDRTYEAVALEDDDATWELHEGRLVAKPPESFRHNDVTGELFFLLANQLSRKEFHVRTNAGRVRYDHDEYHLTFYVPDVFVIPDALTWPLRNTHRLEVYRDPLPLIAEVWSPPITGVYYAYDSDAKTAVYQQRGDLEIYRLDPWERTLTAHRRQSGGDYDETVYRGGTVQPIALPNVTIDLDVLFDYTGRLPSRDRSESE